MKNANVANWVHTQKSDQRDEAIKALALAKEQEKTKVKKSKS